MADNMKSLKDGRVLRLANGDPISLDLWDQEPPDPDSVTDAELKRLMKLLEDRDND